MDARATDPEARRSFAWWCGKPANERLEHPGSRRTGGVVQSASYSRHMTPASVKRIPARSKPLTVRVDFKLERRLQAAAAQAGMSVSDFVREPIAERLDRGAADGSLGLYCA